MVDAESLVCGTCGFDCRASAGACPECGHTSRVYDLRDPASMPPALRAAWRRYLGVVGWGFVGLVTINVSGYAGGLLLVAFGLYDQLLIVGTALNAVAILIIMATILGAHRVVRQFPRMQFGRSRTWPALLCAALGSIAYVVGAAALSLLVIRNEPPNSLAGEGAFLLGHEVGLSLLVVAHGLTLHPLLNVSRFVRGLALAMVGLGGFFAIAGVTHLLPPVLNARRGPLEQVHTLLHALYSLDLPLSILSASAYVIAAVLVLRRRAGV